MYVRVCVYVYVYVCVYVCIYVCMYSYIYMQRADIVKSNRPKRNVTHDFALKY